MSASSRASGPSLAGDLITRIGETARRLFGPARLLFRSNETSEEVLVSRQGPVEIRQTLAGWTLETCVKGEPEQARATGLRRLANYVNGKNRSKERLRVMRPLVQTQEAAGRWRLRVALLGLNSSFVAAVPRNGKVRLRSLDSETLAVLRVPGRPTALSMQHAETAIRHALAPSRWEPVGAPLLRLHSLPAIMPFLNRFEVAIPVADRAHGSAMPDWMRPAVFDRTAGQETPTQASPPIH